MGEERYDNERITFDSEYDPLIADRYRDRVSLRAFEDELERLRQVVARLEAAAPDEAPDRGEKTPPLVP